MSIKVLKSYFVAPCSTPLLGMTVGQLIDQAAEKYGDSEGVICTDIGIRRTFSELKGEIDSLAGGFLALGLQPGERLGCFGPNGHPYYLTQMAAWKAGLILVSINSTSGETELLHCLKNVGMKCIVIPGTNVECISSNLSTYYGKVVQVIPEILTGEPGLIKNSALPELTAVIAMESPENLGSGAYSFVEVTKLGKEENSKRLLEKVEKSIQFDDVCNILFTSDKICIPVTFSHIYGSMIGSLVALHAGAGLVIPSPAFSPKSALEAVQSEKCTVLYGTLVMHLAMLELQTERNYDLTTLRITCTGPGTFVEATLAKLKKTYGIDELMNSYGMTEVCVCFCGPRSDTSEWISKSSGFPMEHFEVKVIDENGKIVPREVPGQLCVRGYGITRGYWNDPEKTQALMKGTSWVHTGDIMILHEDGRGSFVARLKDAIKIGGETAYPKEIEDMLYTNEKIFEVRVFGVPDEYMGEVVAAWVQLKPGQVMTEKDVVEFCLGKIAYSKIPCYTIFVEDFPRTLSGKVPIDKLKEHPLTKRRLAIGTKAKGQIGHQVLD